MTAAARPGVDAPTDAPTLNDLLAGGQRVARSSLQADPERSPVGVLGTPLGTGLVLADSTAGGGGPNPRDLGDLDLWRLDVGGSPEVIIDTRDPGDGRIITDGGDGGWQNPPGWPPMPDGGGTGWPGWLDRGGPGVWGEPRVPELPETTSAALAG